MSGRRGIRIGIAAAVAVFLALATPGAALGQGPTITPTRFDDPSPTPPPCTQLECSLRAALQVQGDATIELQAGTYTVSQGQLSTFFGQKVIQGKGARTTTIAGNNLSRVLFLPETSDVTINDVTITGGNATGQTPQGGGIYVQNPSTLELNRSAVIGNRASTQGGGIFTQSNGLVRITDSTISSNVVGIEGGGQGGGVYGSSASEVQLFNSTISANQAPGLRTDGVGVYALGSLGMTHVTIAGNQAEGSSLRVSSSESIPPPFPVWNAIVTADNGPACSITNRAYSGEHNLDDDGSCGFSRLGDRPGVSPLLGPLQNNGGATNTMALAAGSPAIDAGDSPHCLGFDQRGIARPQIGACDIGAFEYVAPSQPPPSGPQPPEDEQLPPPVAGETVNALPKSGRVRIKVPGSKRFVRLSEGQQVPVGTIIDTRTGHVTLVAAANRQGGTSTAEFWAGVFRLGQTKNARPRTTLTLTQRLSCPKAGSAIAAAKKKRKRRLWGDGSGRFRTKGKHSAATVVGTKWLVEDRCKSTLTRVVRGKVSVRDFVKKKTITLRKGKRYIARAKKN